MKVEFRLLQAVLSAVGGDRVTVALVHWDGTNLRVATSHSALTAVAPQHRQGIRVAIDEYRRQAIRRAKQVADTPLLDIGLAHVFPVREGMGAALYWTPVASLDATDPARHFVQLRRELRLENSHHRKVRRITRHRIDEALRSLGGRLAEVPDYRAFVRIGEAVTFRLAYESPLSWKNGVWHHTVPFDFNLPTEAARLDELRRVCGVVVSSFSSTRRDVAVLIPAMPEDAQTRDEGLERDLRAVRLTLQKQHSIELVVPKRGPFEMDDLEVRIRRDLSAHLKA